MSSATDSSKQAATESAPEEPSSKRAKLETDSNDSNVDNNNGITASDNNKLISDNNNSADETPSKASGSATQVPTKSVNGNDKSKSEQDESDDSDGSEVFDPKVAGKLEEVEDIQSQISKLNELASEEILKVEQKFNKLRRPHYEKRNTILKEVPNFWVTTLANHPLIAPMIDSAEVEDCLHYMVNLDVEEFDDIKSGYSIRFYFAENPYISNEVLTKTLKNGPNDEIVVAGSTIIYKDTPEGLNLEQAVSRASAQQRRNKALGLNSFFGWLAHSGSTTDDIAEIIKDQVWPSPLEFFFSAPDDYNGGSDESDDEDEYDEEADNDGEVDIPEEELLDEDLDNDDDLDDEDVGDDDDDDDEDDDEEE